MAGLGNISVIIVSHDRPEYLQKMLACLRLQDISGFEVIVVTNTENALKSAILPDNLNVIPFKTANIAAARNIGIAAARGAFVAFCDDDALPDPSWLQKLMAPFQDPLVGATGGFTRSSNGISAQWGAVLTDNTASQTPLELSNTTVFEPNDQTAPVMIGTNCAFRISALLHIGGYDENFAYYLDDSDISLRLSKAGWKQVILPDCQVHHSFGESAQRSARFVPKSLKSLGRSKAYFCQKYANREDTQAALQGFIALHKKALDKKFLLGLLDADTVKNLRHSLDEGIAEGQKLTVFCPKPIARPASGAQPDYAPSKSRHIVVAVRRFDQTARQIVAALCKNNLRVTVIELSWSAMFMQVNFAPAGFWHHKGGQFGKILRSEPIWQKSTFEAKILQECKRLAEMRKIDFLTFLAPGRFDASLSPKTFGMCSLNDYRVLDDSLLWLTQDGK